MDIRKKKVFGTLEDMVLGNLLSVEEKFQTSSFLGNQIQVNIITEAQK